MRPLLWLLVILNYIMLCKYTQVKCRSAGRLTDRPSDSKCLAHHLNDVPVLGGTKGQEVWGFLMCGGVSHCALVLYGDCTLCFSAFAWRF